MTILYTGRDAEETVLSTEMNALADDAAVITGTAVSNDTASTERRPFADFELSLGVQGSARSAGAYVELYLLPTLDGTNYAYGSASVDPSANHLVGNFLFDAAVTARVEILRKIELPASDFHVVVHNKTGQAFHATASTLTMRRYSYEDV